ncbi:4228_t:CDS:1, partial [Racocetra persica]
MANNGFNIDFTKEIQELEQQFNLNTFLPLDKLIACSSRKRKHLPRAQNTFLLFWKDLNAFLRSSNIKIGDISNLTSKIWKNENFTYQLWKEIIIDEINPFYKKLSKIAKM